MGTGFRLVPKFDGNCLIILYECRGEVRVIAQILMPADQQLSDNVKAADDICSIMRTRIKRSL